MWLLYAFSGPVFWAISTHIDKYLVDRYFRDSDTAVLIVFTALIGLLMLPLIAIFDSTVLKPGLGAIAVMAVSGVLYMGAMLFYLRAIQSEEASVVAALFQASTLFTFLLGWLFLHETLGWAQGGGCILIVGRCDGAVAGQDTASEALQAEAGAVDAGRHLCAVPVQCAVQILRRARRLLDHHLLEHGR